MTQEDKQLLLKDLCARQFYKTKVLGPWEKDGPCELSAIDLTSDRQVRVFEDWYKIEEVKPYLRPMSSMTLVERIELKAITKGAIQTIGLEDIVVTTDKGFDYLNAHHIDYRGLIPMGLALEAPEGMYNYENN